MAKYKSIVVTNAGLELIAAVQSGDTIEFTAIKTGSGVYDGTENLSELTGLKNLKQTFGVNGITRDETVIKVRSVIDNNGLDAGYNITEIGLFAKDKSNNEILYAIVVSETGLEDYLPAYADAPATITSMMYINVSNVDSGVTFQATVVPGTYVTVEDFEEYKAQQSQYGDAFVASIEIQGKTITAKSKDGEVLYTGETQDTTYGVATITTAGLMDPTDKVKLNGIETGAQKNTITGVKGSAESTYRTGDVNITKGNIGLGNVDNTADADKPVSTAQQAALDLKVNTADYEAKIAALERQDILNSQATTNVWDKAQRVEAALESHEMDRLSNPHNVTAEQVGLENVDNTADADKPVSTAQQTALDLKEDIENVIGENLIDSNFTQGWVRTGSHSYESGKATFSKGANASSNNSYHCKDYYLEKGKTYAISAKVNTSFGGGGWISTMYVFDTNPVTYETISVERGNGKIETTFTVNKDCKYVRVQFSFNEGGTNGFATEGTEITFSEMMLEESTVAHQYQPYNLSRKGLVEQIMVDNLIPYPHYETTHTQYGVDWTDLGDGTVQANGTNTEANNKASQYYFNSDTPLDLKPNTTYTLSGCPKGGSATTYGLRIIINYRGEGEVYYRDTGDGVTFTTPSNYQNCRIMLDVLGGVTVNNLVFKPMLEEGSVAHPYQPYELSRQKLRADIDNIGLASASADGLMSSADKTKLDKVNVVTGTTESNVLSLSLVEGKSYLITTRQDIDAGMYGVYIVVPRNGSFVATDAYLAGSGNVVISGTTFTLTFNNDTPINYSYFEFY